MSGIEPRTSAKVILHTTKGDLEIELWAKETPITCRNFLQHCANGYYNNTIFHRIIPEFIIQGGDPSGSGFGGESIYASGKFKDEFNTRLKFNRRGILGMANSGLKNDNDSQFFITLNECNQLNNKNTVFGKIVGETIYNLLKISQVELVDKERPLYPTKIVSTEIVIPYFDDLITNVQIENTVKPSFQERNKNNNKKIIKPKVKISFDNDDDEEDENFNLKPTHKVVEKYLNLGSKESEERLINDKKEVDKKEVDKKEVDKVDKKVDKVDKVDNKKKEINIETFEKDKNNNEKTLDEIKQEIEKVKKQLKRSNEEEKIGNKKQKMTSIYEIELEKYKKKSKNKIKNKNKNENNKNHEKNTLKALENFKKKLNFKTNTKEEKAKNDQESLNNLCSIHNIENCESCNYFDKLDNPDSSEDDLDFIKHKLVYNDNKGKDLQDRQKIKEYDGLTTMQGFQ